MYGGGGDSLDITELFILFFVLFLMKSHISHSFQCVGCNASIISDVGVEAAMFGFEPELVCPTLLHKVNYYMKRGMLEFN